MVEVIDFGSAVQSQLPGIPAVAERLQRLPICILGVGGVASYAHIPAYLSAGLNISLLVDPAPEALSKAQNAVGGAAKLGASVADLAVEARAGRVAAIDVAVPTPLHFQVLSELLSELGSKCPHILAQKPLASSAQDADKIVRRAADLGVTIGVNLNARWVETFAHARTLVKKGAIGPVRFATLINRGLNTKKPGEWRGEMPRFIGYEMAVHHVDLLMWMFGRPSWVFAKLRNVRGFGIRADNVAAIHLGFGAELSVHVVEDWICRDTSAAQFHPSNEQLVLSGEGGTITVTPRELRLARPDGSTLSWRSEQSWFPCAFAGPMIDLLEARCDCRAPTTDPKFHVTVLRTLEAAYRSSEENQVVQLEDQS